ncbi:hypothetical protein BH24GEM2_BH24GEM2_19790 [soil metagenome]
MLELASKDLLFLAGAAGANGRGYLEESDSYENLVALQ